MISRILPLWEGPLHIGGCRAGVSLIKAIYEALGSDYILVVAYSGSSTTLHFINLNNCQELWPAIDSQGGGIQVSGDLATLEAVCECPTGPVCSCTAARVFRLSLRSQPIELRVQSLAVTRETLGVEFNGVQQVENPKTSRARLVVH